MTIPPTVSKTALLFVIVMSLLALLFVVFTEGFLVGAACLSGILIAWEL